MTITSRLVTSAVLASLLSASTALANSGGIPGRARIGCSGGGCHLGGVAPTLTFDAPSMAAPGQTVNLSVTAQGPQAGAAMPKAGINVEAEGGALLADAGGALKPLLQQLVHAQPVLYEGDTARFTFQWTAPDTEGPVNLFAAVNSVNGDFTITGDLSAMTQATIQVVAGAAPGGSGGEGNGGTPVGGDHSNGGSSGGSGVGTGGAGVDGEDAGVDGMWVEDSDTSGGCQAQPGRGPRSAALFASIGLLTLTFRRGRARRR